MCGQNLILDFPLLNYGNPLDWVSGGERYFKFHQVPNQQKKEIASMHLEGDMMPWIDWFKAKYPNSSWSQFMDAFLCHFDNKGGIDFYTAIAKLEQGNSTVETYEIEFLRLPCRLPNWSDEQLRGCYISRLERELQFEVLFFEPISLASAIK